MPRTTWSPAGRGWPGSSASARAIRCRCTASRLSLAGRRSARPAHLERLAALVSASSRRWCRSIWPGAPGGGALSARPAAGAAHAPTRCGASSATSRSVQDTIGRPIALENPSHYLAVRRARVRRDRLPGRDRAPQRLRAAARRQQRPCQREQPRLSARGVHRCRSGRTDRRGPPRRAQCRPVARRPPPDRLARRAGGRGGLGAVRASDRAHRGAADADRARRELPPSPSCCAERDQAHAAAAGRSSLAA